MTLDGTQRFELRRALRVMWLPLRRELTESVTARADEHAEALVDHVLDETASSVDPFEDQLAALVAGPRLAKGRALSPRLLAHRFAPRADDAVALAVAALDKSAQPAALEALFAEAGERSVVQCGRVLAWNPPLLVAPVASAIVDALLPLLAPDLGYIAAAGALPGASAAAQALRERILARVGEQLASPPTAPACAYILGLAAPFPHDEFAPFAAGMLASAQAQPFLAGLIAAPHIPGLTDLTRRYVADGEHERALAIASRIPIDELGDYLVEALDVPSAPRRMLAALAVELIRHDEVDGALAARLADPSPEVAAAAAHALLGRDRRDLIARHSAREINPVRRAIVLASLGEPSPAVIDQLRRGMAADREAGNAYAEPSPLARLLERLSGSAGAR